jgi:predicted transcriptional regulator
MLEGHATGSSAIAEVMERKVSTVTMDAPAQLLPQIFERGEVALVVDEDRRLEAILTKLDMIEFMTHRPAVT